MNRRRRTLLLGLALLMLLAGGLVVAVFWPMPSDAERDAVRLKVGMTPEEVCELNELEEFAFGLHGKWTPHAEGWQLPDGSILEIDMSDGSKPGTRVAAVRTLPPPPVHPLTRLRPTLARVLPFVGE